MSLPNIFAPSRIAPRLRWLNYLVNCKLPQSSPQEILEGHKDLKTNVPVVSTHWETATLFEHVFIASLLQVIRPQRIFEIGTSVGLVTTTLAANSPDTTEINTLDFSNEPRIGSFFRDRPEQRKIRQHCSSSTKFDFRPYAGSVDLVFIDGSHDFQDVRHDSERSMQMLSPKGVILWHDVSPAWPGVLQALETSPEAANIHRVEGTSIGLYAAPGSPVFLGRKGQANLAIVQ